MKFLIPILLLFSISGKALTPSAPPLSYYLVMSSTNLAATYPNGPQLQATAVGGTFARVDIANTSSSDIEVNCYSSTKPAAEATGSFIVPATTTYSTYADQLINVPLGGKCWARSFSGTISSGKFVMIGWQY